VQETAITIKILILTLPTRTIYRRWQKRLQTVADLLGSSQPGRGPPWSGAQSVVKMASAFHVVQGSQAPGQLPETVAWDFVLKFFFFSRPHLGPSYVAELFFLEFGFKFAELFQFKTHPALWVSAHPNVCKYHGFNTWKADEMESTCTVYTCTVGTGIPSFQVTSSGVSDKFNFYTKKCLAFGCFFPSKKLSKMGA
jgi:hypothetical protein